MNEEMLEVVSELKKAVDDIKCEIGDIKCEIADLTDDICDNLRCDIEDSIEDTVIDAVEDAVRNAVKGMMDDADAKNRLWVLSQDKKILLPITFADVHPTSTKDPRHTEYPFVIGARVSIFTYNTVGWYKSEEEACAELRRLTETMNNMPNDRYTVYEIN